MKQQKRQFKQLSIEDREAIQEMLEDGYSLRSIADHLGRSHSTISRELKAYSTLVRKRYTPRIVQEKVETMRVRRGQRPRLKNQFIRDYVEEKLKINWSPEQIAGRLKRDHPGYSISHEAIYLYIYSRCQRDGWGVKVEGEDLRRYLRRKHRRRKRKYVPRGEGQGTIRDRVSIEKRPKYIEKRKQLGHWEGDSVVSRQSSVGLNTLVERKMGYAKITKILDSSSDETARAVERCFHSLPLDLRRSITTDNGKENAKHKEVSSALKLSWYFCHPYSSHERGTNENTNGLIREYFPKKTDFALVTNERIQEVEDLLNDRSRKRLDFQTPRELFNRSVVH